MDINPAEITSTDAYLFLFHQDELLIKEKEGITQIPLVSDMDFPLTQLAERQFIGILDGHECFIAHLHIPQLPAGFAWTKVRPLYGQLADDFFWFTCRAFHLINWLNTNKFCGCCGGSLKMSGQELALECPLCSHLVYPRISPAIIVAVTHNNQLLLARSKRFPPNQYGVIAGFVEPGETLEECVQRELKEEVGVQVHNINYFGSQPWPFPDSLMVAFTAQSITENITIDNREIVAADWFSLEKFPTVSNKPSIGRQLIDWFITQQQHHV